MTKLDSRLHACRPDLADVRLRGRVEARQFTEGRPMRVVDPILSVRREPRPDAMQVTQALMGEGVQVFDEQEGWAWIQLEADGYVGYVAASGLRADGTTITHKVSVPLTFLYPAPNLKSQPATHLTMNAKLAVDGLEGGFARLHGGGYVFPRHLAPCGEVSADFVAVAELFLHAPYYWGGKSVQGLDCSGLVQLALEACGRQCPRDSDMQESHLGLALPRGGRDGLLRGDLVFWNGHVGIMADSQTLLHANGNHMMVVAEPLHEAVSRIAANYGEITSIRRVQ